MVVSESAVVVCHLGFTETLDAYNTKKIFDKNIENCSNRQKMFEMLSNEENSFSR